MYVGPDISSEYALEVSGLYNYLTVFESPQVCRRVIVSGCCPDRVLPESGRRLEMNSGAKGALQNL